MKIFIWTDVLRDHTPGMAIAYADTCEEALRLFPPCIQRELLSPSKVIDCDVDKQPTVEWVFGGG